MSETVSFSQTMRVVSIMKQIKYSRMDYTSGMNVVRDSALKGKSKEEIEPFVRNMDLLREDYIRLRNDFCHISKDLGIDPIRMIILLEKLTKNN